MIFQLSKNLMVFDLFFMYNVDDVEKGRCCRMQNQENTELYEQFRRKIETSAWIILLLIFLLEAGIGIVWACNGWIIEGDDPLTYSVKYIVAPTVINLIAVGMYHYTEYHTSISSTSKNSLLIMTFTILCLTISVVHNAVRIASISFLLPVFLSAIFADVKVTTRAFILNNLCYMGCMFLSYSLAQPQNQRFLILDIIAGAILMVAAYLITRSILQYEQKTRSRLMTYNTEQDLLIERLRIDALSGLYNHNTFYKILEESIKAAKDSDIPLILAILDIDDFKSINDTYGHTRGDCVLRELAAVMKELDNDNTILARYGGEEFCVLFTSYSLTEAEHRMNTLRLRFENLKIKEINSHKVTFSAGITVFREEFDSATAMIDAADEALYTAKRNGKNQVVVNRRA